LPSNPNQALHLRVEFTKFKMVGQLTLLGYSYEEGYLVLELVALGTMKTFIEM